MAADAADAGAGCATADAAGGATAGAAGGGVVEPASEDPDGECRAASPPPTLPTTLAVSTAIVIPRPIAPHDRGCPDRCQQSSMENRAFFFTRGLTRGSRDHPRKESAQTSFGSISSIRCHAPDLKRQASATASRPR